MKRNYYLSVLLLVAFCVSISAQKKVLWYTDGSLAVYEEPLRDSLAATDDFVISGEVGALEFAGMTSATDFLLYDMVIMNESGASNSGVPYHAQAGSPKPLLCLEPYVMDDWFGADVLSVIGTASVDKSECEEEQKLIVKAPDHEIFSGLLSAPGAYDTIVWTTGKEVVNAGEAHIVFTGIGATADIGGDATLLASSEEVEREDPSAGVDNGFVWAVETNSHTKRMFIMGTHVTWCEKATDEYWKLLFNAAYWVAGLSVPTGIDNACVNAFKLNAYPSPFNDKLSVSFELPKAKRVDISIYNCLGQVVLQKSDVYAAGSNVVELNLDVENGLYFVNLNDEATIKIIK